MRKLFLVLLVFLTTNGAAVSEEKRIVIVKSSESPPFQLAAEGVKKEIRKGVVHPVFVEYDLPVGAPDKQQIGIKLRELSPDLIVTVGSKSTALVSRHIKDIPIVFSAVLNPISSGFARSMRSSGCNLLNRRLPGHTYQNAAGEIPAYRPRSEKGGRYLHPRFGADRGTGREDM